MGDLYGHEGWKQIGWPPHQQALERLAVTHGVSVADHIDMKPILFLEDDPDDVWLTKRAIKTAGLKIIPSFVGSCAELKRYMDGSTCYSARDRYPLPQMVFIDLKLEASSGFDALRYFATHEAFRHIPVVVLTSSGRLEDQAQAMSLGAREFITKPATNVGLAAMLSKAVQDHLSLDGLQLSSREGPQTSPFSTGKPR